MKGIICPVCGKELNKADGALKCQTGHSFDIAREGYCNLVAGTHKKGSLMGDSRDMALSRRAFLEKGYFDSLLEGLISIIKSHNADLPNIADICCGEGYYSRKIAEEIPCRAIGFDLSRDMVKLAAKKKSNCTYLVANLARIPLKDKDTDIALNLFAPFHQKEFTRILKDDGIIISVVAGKDHLFEIKEILYDTPYKNDERPPQADSLKIREKIKITKKLRLASKEDIDALFRMTPYYYRTSDKDKEKLSAFGELEVTTDFAVFIYEKNE